MNKRSTFVLFSLTAVLVLILAACSSAPATPTTPAATETPAAITLTDGLGRAVILDTPAQKIISLAPSNTEMLFALGAGAQVAGRDDFSNYPEEAAALPSVGGSMGNYNLEMITSLQPDLVLAAEINTPEQVKAIEELGFKVYYLPNPQDFDGLFENLRTVGALTGKMQQAEQLASTLLGRVQAVTGKLASVTEKPVLFYEIDASEPTKPYTAGKGTFIDMLITAAGGQNAAGELEFYPQLSLEALLEINPAIILLGDSNYGITVESVGQRPGWDALDAVKNGKVYPFNDDLVSRPTPRMVDALEQIARLLHPDLFE